MIAQSESLPNITGFFNAEGLMRDYPGSNIQTSGALSMGSGSKNTPHLGAGDFSAATGISFDASGSNPVYKENGSVTPKNTSIRVWKRTS